MMRIIAGTKRGKRLATLDGEDTRPTLERLKQALFSAIQFELADRTVLDLFGGSGQLGLEALSRGAAFCHFNDMNPAAVKIIQKNLKECGFEKDAKVTCADYNMCVKMIERDPKKPDLVFLDPPYASHYYRPALQALLEYRLLNNRQQARVLLENGELDKACKRSFPNVKNSFFRL